MAITLDTIVNKVFKIVPNGGYDNNEVEAFLDEILEEMETREAETNSLKAENARLSQELAQARAAVQAASSAAAAKAAVEAAPAPAVSDRHSAESFELVLTKAKGAYEEIVAAADARADEIITKANEDAAAIRAKAESQIDDLTQKLAQLRSQAAEHCETLKKAMDGQAATIDQLKKLL